MKRFLFYWLLATGYWLLPAPARAQQWGPAGCSPAPGQFAPLQIRGQGEGVRGQAAVREIRSGTGSSSYRSDNFVVSTPWPDVSKNIAGWAEHYRQQKAVEWLGREMPRWPEACPVKVTFTPSAVGNSRRSGGGATSFAFDPNGIRQTMHVEGTYEQIIKDILPHEVTHTVLAYHFRQPVPRWVDEGIAVTSESTEEQEMQARIAVNCLQSGRALTIRGLFNLHDYPKNQVMEMYAGGYSFTAYLLDLKDRQNLLAFVHDGKSQGWDRALSRYGFSSVEQAQQSWQSYCLRGGLFARLRKRMQGHGGNVPTQPVPTGNPAPAPTGPDTMPTADQPLMGMPMPAPTPGPTGPSPDLSPLNAKLDQLIGNAKDHGGLLGKIATAIEGQKDAQGGALTNVRDKLASQIDAVKSDLGTHTNLLNDLGKLQIGQGEVLQKLQADAQKVLPAVEKVGDTIATVGANPASTGLLTALIPTVGGPIAAGLMAFAGVWWRLRKVSPLVSAAINAGGQPIDFSPVLAAIQSLRTPQVVVSGQQSAASPPASVVTVSGPPMPQVVQSTGNTFVPFQAPSALAEAYRQAVAMSKDHVAKGLIQAKDVPDFIERIKDQILAGLTAGQIKGTAL